MEREADRLSIELTGFREAFVRAEVDLARRNVANVEPGRLAVLWLYSHPPALERIALAGLPAPGTRPGGPDGPAGGGPDARDPGR
jgi:hypothetical protein